MTDGLKFVTAYSQGAELDVRINDVPVFRFSDPSPSTAVSPVGYYGVRGKNYLFARLDVRGGPTTVAAKATVRIALFVERELVLPNQGDTIAELALDLSNPTPPPTAFVLTEAREYWDWQYFDQLTGDARTFEDARTFADRISHAWGNSEPSPIVAAAAWRLADVPLAFPNRTPDECRALMSQAVAESAKGEVPARQFSPVICGNGKLMDCLGLDRLPYVRKIASDGTPLYFPMIIGLKSDRWGIVR